MEFKNGEKYFYLDENWEIKDIINTNSEFDNENIKNKNYFKTPEKVLDLLKYNLQRAFFYGNSARLRFISEELADLVTKQYFEKYKNKD